MNITSCWTLGTDCITTARPDCRHTTPRLVYAGGPKRAQTAVLLSCGIKLVIITSDVCREIAPRRRIIPFTPLLKLDQTVCSVQGHTTWRVGDPDPPKVCRRGSEYVLTPQNVTFFHSKLLLHNYAISKPWRMKDLWQKWKVKLIFRGAWNSSMAWPDWPRPPYFTTVSHWCRQICM